MKDDSMIDSGDVHSIGYKICSASITGMRPCLVTLEIPKTAKRIPTEFTDNDIVLAYRCDWAKVINIVELNHKNGVTFVLDSNIQLAYNCFYNPDGKAIKYQVGKRVWVRNFDSREYIGFSNGIHYCPTQIAALMYFQGWKKGGD